MDPADRALLLSLQRGDPVAFGRVHAQLGPRIFNFLSRMVGRKDLAEDLFQETWIKLAIHAPRLTPDTDLPAWLYTVARNLARSERRSERSRPASSAEAAGEQAAYEGGSPYEWTAATETQARLEQALADLPAPFREVLLLIVVEGLDHERVAAILGLTREALRQRLARARAKLAERHEELAKASRPAREKKE